jgi:ligand-binding sensor protein
MSETILPISLTKPQIANIIDIKQWNHIQDLFADVIGVSIYTVDTHGHLLTRPSKMMRLCNELKYSSLFCLKQCVDCNKDTIQNYLSLQKVDVQCHCGLHNFIIPILVDSAETIGYVIAGPVMVGGKKSRDEYLSLCMNAGINPDIFFDSLHEIKVFSYKSLNSVATLLRDAINYMIKLGYQRSKLEAWLPGFLNLNESNNQAYSELYFNKLVESLLEIAMAVTKGESGSVMIFDKERNDFFITVSRGHCFRNNDHKQKFPNTIAGFVINEKKGFLLNDLSLDINIKPTFIRPEIKSSIVVPIQIGTVTYGVFSVNSHSEHIKFSRSNLNLLNQLGEMAAVAFSQFDLKKINPFND